MAVVCLTTDVLSRARLASALRGRVVAVCCCTTLAETRAALARGGVRALVVETRDADGTPTDALVREVRTRWPTTTVLAFYAPGRTSAADVHALLAAGVHELLLRGVDESDHALRAALLAAEQHCAVDLVIERARAVVPEAAWPVADFFLRRAIEPVTVEDCAAALGVHRKTLGNRLRSAGCPSPLVVRAWCRLLLVTRMLEEPGRTVESIALQLDYPSASALRNQVRRFLGMTLSEAAGRGGFAYALERFTVAMSRHPPARHGRRFAVADEARVPAVALAAARRVAELPMQRAVDA
jgi:AraC-like DNA-binding protein